MEGVQMTTSGHNVGLEEEKPMNDTPRTDAAWKTTPSVYDFIVEMKRIERELNAANVEIEEKRKDVVWLATEKAKLEERIKRLEKAGDEVVINYVNSLSAFEMWRKAKEAKP